MFNTQSHPQHQVQPPMNMQVNQQQRRLPLPSIIPYPPPIDSPPRNYAPRSQVTQPPPRMNLNSQQQSQQHSQQYPQQHPYKHPQQQYPQQQNPQQHPQQHFQQQPQQFQPHRPQQYPQYNAHFSPHQHSQQHHQQPQQPSQLYQQNYKSFQSLEIPSLPAQRPPPPPPPKLRRDPVLDSKEEIAKWLEQRRKRYPRPNRQIDEPKEEELSKLELKLRKKVRMMSGSSKRLQVKIKQLKDLFTQMTGGYKPRRRQQVVVEERKASNDFNLDDYFVKDETVPTGSPKIEVSKVQEEINAIELKLKQQHPREFYKNRREQSKEEPMNTSQKKKLKARLKTLKASTRVDRENGETVQEDHAKDMITKLRQQRDDITNMLELSQDYRSNPVNFKHKSNTLYASLVLDQIFLERSQMLQAIRWIVKNNFFEMEAITPSDNMSSISPTEESDDAISEI